VVHLKETDMKRIVLTGLAGVLAAGAILVDTKPVQAQSVGYVTGIPGRDPADDDEFGWGPAYRPETTFAQPGTPPTPGQIAGYEYYRRTGRTVYPPIGYYNPEAVAPGYAPGAVYAPRRIVRTPRYENRRIVKQRAAKKRVVNR
jgi:hypothetical protein